MDWCIPLQAAIEQAASRCTGSHTTPTGDIISCLAERARRATQPSTAGSSTTLALSACCKLCQHIYTTQLVSCTGLRSQARAAQAAVRDEVNQWRNEIEQRWSLKDRWELVYLARMESLKELRLPAKFAAGQEPKALDREVRGLLKRVEQEKQMQKYAAGASHSTLSRDREDDSDEVEGMDGDAAHGGGGNGGGLTPVCMPCTQLDGHATAPGKARRGRPKAAVPASAKKGSGSDGGDSSGGEGQESGRGKKEDGGCTKKCKTQSMGKDGACRSCYAAQ